MAYVYATAAFVTSNNGGRVRVQAGDVFDPDHPVVQAHPELFSDKPKKVSGKVEKATAEPGEKRTTSRPAKRA